MLRTDALAQKGNVSGVQRITIDDSALELKWLWKVKTSGFQSRANKILYLRVLARYALTLKKSAFC